MEGSCSPKLVSLFRTKVQFLLLALIIILGWLYMLYGMIHGTLNVAVWIIFFGLSIVLNLVVLLRFRNQKKENS